MRWLAVPAMAVAAAGCVSSGDITLLHREITDVSRQVENLGRQSTGKEDLQAMSKKLADQNAQVLKSSADVQVELQQLHDQIQALQSNLDATNQRLATLSTELAATRERLSGGQGPGPAAAAAGTRRASRSGRGPGDPDPARSRRARPAVQRRLRGLPPRQLRPRDPGVLRVRQEVPLHRPRGQRALLDRRVLLLEEAVQGGDRRLHPAAQHLQDVGQGRRCSAQEGPRLSRARRPLAGGHQPAVRPLRAPGHQGGGSGTLPARRPRGQGEVSQNVRRRVHGKED